MARLVLNPFFFVAVVEYDKNSKVMMLTFRTTGHKYAYSNVPASRFAEIQATNNKGNYIARNIVGKYESKFVEFVPIAEIQQMQMTTTKYYKTFLAR